MSHFEFSITTQDGIQLYAQGWEPAQNPQGCVLIVHGIGEHSGRYAHVAEALDQAGYAVLAFDLRGHGKSQGKRGHVPKFEALLDDLSLLIAESDRRYPGLPTFLYGHSLGGTIVMSYALQRQPNLAGVVATGPSLRLAFDPPPSKVALGRLMDKILPAFTMPSGLETQALSRDPEVIQKYENDPLVHDMVSGRLFFGFMDAGSRLLAKAAEFPLPLLLMHGSADRLTSPKASQEFAQKMGEKCTLKIWDGFYHEIHNEPEKEEVLSEIISWLNHQI
jgi:acylglycerol lipase